jgi:hypothetical protein
MEDWNQVSSKGTTMLKYLLCLILMTGQMAFAQSKYVAGEGKFKADDGDSLSFIKKQLIHEAFIDVLSKEMDEMDMNKELFWQKFNESFDNMLAPADEALKKKYKIEDEKVDPKNKQRYVDALRLKKLKNRLRFGNLHRIIRSYAVKRMSRSAQDPKSRFIQLEAKVDRNLLAKTYYRFVQGKKSSDYGSLYINVEYELQHCSYTDLGVENDKDFTSVVNQHWLEWLSSESNKPKNIANIEIIDESKKKQLKEYQSLPLDKLLDSIPEIFVNSLLLNIKVVIDRKNFNKEFKEYEFSYDGAIYLQDLQTGKILTEAKIPKELRKYTNVPDVELSSRIANHVYRMPLEKFTRLKTAIANIPPLSLTKVITLFDYKNLNDVDKFINLVKNRGIKYSLGAQLISIGSNKAEIAVFFDGELKDLKELLNSVESAKKDLSFEFIDSDNALGIKFNKIEEVVDS